MMTNLNSKKFIAYMVADTTWTLTLLVGLYYLKVILLADNGAVIVSQAGILTLLLSIVLTKGFIQVGYIGSQAWLDRYLKLASVATNKPDQQ